jgi:uncharacterized membrane protein YbhN (UPF0104 family)
MDRVRKGRLARAALRVGVAAVTGAFTVTLARSSLSGAIGVLASSNLLTFLLGAPVILAGTFLLRAARFGALLRGRDSSPSFRDVLGSVVLSQAANNVLPLRAGELVRTRDFLVRGYTLSRVASAQVMEKFVELASLLLWTAPVVGRDVFVRRPVLASAALVVLVLAAGVWLVHRGRATEDSTAVLVSIKGAMRELSHALGWSLLADGLEVALILLCIRSLGISGGVRESLTVLATVNLAIALPSTPGNLGTLEAGAALGLVASGVPRDSAIAFALLYRCVQWVPVTLAGALVWWLRRPLARPAQDVSLGTARSS